MEVARQTAVPQLGGIDRQIQRLTASWEQKPTAGDNTCRNTLSCDGLVSSDSVGTSLRIKNTKGTQGLRGPHTFVSVAPRNPTKFSL